MLGAASLTGLALAGCTSSSRRMAAEPTRPYVDPMYVSMYAPVSDNGYYIEGFDPARVDPKLLRQVVDYPTSERPGTIIVEPGQRFLYFVQEGGRAMRYGVGVGREGYDYQGEATIGRKASWPRWTPTPTMIREDPEKNGPWAGGMEGGPQNPLGARALYLYNNGRDTLYRIHGTNDPASIGHSLSSGCVRLFNHDIIDLHARVPVGSKVIVRQAQPQFI
ncbi:L,D-transpeptidase [Arsenicitalea aurantiaca]|uniref:L,D-transpeptidase n=2 Tax=Arsenicitalea aurantiaca TaxID=1783274 RepID=A0A433XM65_9HYPH|nr:L,D-transpeptidase [Arsenicitalea aurantiaca]